ncbi:MAG: hypothetical protein C4325_14210 [Blastocatellia bacterium]
MVVIKKIHFSHSNLPTIGEFTITTITIYNKLKVSAKLKISEPDGQTWEFPLEPGRVYTIGRSKENDVVLNDRRVSRKHAHIVSTGGNFTIVDGFYENGQLRRSVNHLYVNGSPVLEKSLLPGDSVMIGETIIRFEDTAPRPFIPEHQADYSLSH